METLNFKKAIRQPRLKACESRTFAGDSNVRRGRNLTLLIVFCVFLAVNFSRGQQARPTESQVKAAYLFNFGKFVRWPAVSPGSDDSLEICVLGKNPFGSVLDDTVRGETIEGRKVIAKTLPALQDAGGCRILFVSLSEEGRVAGILSEAKHLKALTVSDIPHFAEHGGMIEFINQEERIRFEVNAAPLEEAGLTVSSELLKVATKVIHKSGGGN